MYCELLSQQEKARLFFSYNSILMCWTDGKVRSPVMLSHKQASADIQGAVATRWCEKFM
jgi:hypothetical protein